MSYSVEQEYGQLRANFQRADENRDGYAKILKEVATALEHSRGRFMFTNVKIGLPPTLNASLRQVKTVSAGEWPTAEQIQIALAEWHNAKNAMRSAWNAIPKDRRSHLVPPPGTD